MQQLKPIPEAWNLNEKGISLFSGDAAKESELAFYVRRPEIEALWRDDLGRGTQPEASNFMHFVVGNLGQGKSISLLRLNEMVLSDYKGELLPVTLSLIAEDTMKPRDFLCRLLARIDYADLARRFDPSRLGEAIGRIPPNLEESRVLMKNVLLPRRSVSYEETFFPARQLTQEVATETYAAVGRYFSGLSVTQKELRLLGLGHRLDSEETAWKHLAALRWVLGGLGYTAIVLMVDEFEYLFSLVSRNRRPQYVALLQRVYDSCSSSPSMAALDSFFAVSAEGWQQLAGLADHEAGSAGPTVALQRRLSSSTLTNLGSRQMRELIEKRLQADRERPVKSGEEFAPFTQDFLKFVEEETMGVPGSVVKICRKVLDGGRARQVAKLDKAFAVQVLAERS